MEAKVFLRLLFALTLFMQLNTYSAAVAGGNTLSLGSSLTISQTLISKNGTFELGFFSPVKTKHWYIGIWYAQISEKTIVWVANRETPIRNIPGVLNLSRDGYLRLFDAKGVFVWSANVTKKASRGVILESGNFLMLAGDNKSEPVWQSFDHPVDTWLPGMKIGGERKLVGWKNPSDPAAGLFSFQTDPSGARQLVLNWNNSVRYWESGVWDGKFFGYIPELSEQTIKLIVKNTRSGLYLTFTVALDEFITRLVLEKTGSIRLYIWLDGKWWILWYQPIEQCSVYDLCGAYGTCNPNHNIQLCSCMEGFKPRDIGAWNSQDWGSSGCVRESPLNCDAKKSDRFNEFFVDTLNSLHYSFPSHTKNHCQEACLRNCSCSAFSYEPTSTLCQIWLGNLLNLRNSIGNSTLFIRLSAFQSSSSKLKTKAVVVAVLGVIAGLAIALGVFLSLIWRRRQFRSTHMCADSSNGFLRMFSYKELKIATSNFRYKLGRGGFGSVFKGTLPDNTLVAVKKLEDSRQVEKQFRAEISSLGNIQHVNLVRLRGFCAEASRRLLVYDYMPNGSLNSFLFSSNSSNSKRQHKVLDWKTRFKIALGTAKGLVYLHENCRDHIIHGDVKPENILLDGDFSPKLADFGLSKLVGRDFSRVLTTTRGTRGYLAPEWSSGLPVTPKVDVYSFGMTLFELISGRRNLDLTVQESSMYYYPAWAASEINKGNMMNIVDKRIANNAVGEEVRRATLVSLLCIQNDENVRPNMAQVLLMLEGNMEAHTPQIPNMIMTQQADRSNSSESDGDGVV